MPAAREQVAVLARPVAIDQSLLPNGKDDSLVLLPASRTEAVQAQIIHSDDWSGPLDRAAYVDREAYLLTSDATAKGKSTTWILTSPSLAANPDGTRPILSACETVVRDAYVARNGEVEKIMSHVICSVFCRPENRARGYASRMLVELGKKLETWQQVDSKLGTFSTLYSDIGNQFYSRLGWKVYPSDHIRLPTLSPKEYEQQVASLPAVEELDIDRLRGLPLVDQLETKLKKFTSSNPSLPGVAYAPDMKSFQWHFMREEFLTNHLGQAFPSAKGAIHEQSGLGLIWTRTYAKDPKENLLYSLYIIIPEDGQTSEDDQVQIFASILLRAQLEAYKYDMQQGVEIWNPPAVMVKAAGLLAKQEVKVVTRETNSLCCLKWDENPDQKVEWLANERFSWC